ncbi:glycosyltransferase family 2 protein [Mycobacterium kyogaense]|uniref:glycosyltransferase family 2 protein n=1 Tax=Mycobacterium kyogaense TaxID=2212479 RepID=UPI000DAB88E0|nr:glycosyltransferase [Mycobacterium kyogaense]
MGGEPPRIGVAVTTVGRWDALRELLADLAGQTRPVAAVAIAHHDPAGAAALDAVIADFTDTLTIRTTLSARGISNGRNAAAALLPDDVEWLWFPNDTSRVAPDFVEHLSRHCTPSATVCAGRLLDSEGPRNPLPAPGTALTKRSAWFAIEPATVFRRDAFVAAGEFDPGRGSGAETPWQSAEGPDLLLRMAELDGFGIVWADDVIVQAQTEFAHLPPQERRRKLRNYGRGAGNLLRTWHYPLWYKAAHLVAAALMPVRNPAKFSPRDGVALLVGRAEGLAGRPFTRETDTRAVLR